MQKAPTFLVGAFENLDLNLEYYGQTNPEGRTRLTRRLIMDLIRIIIAKPSIARFQVNFTQSVKLSNFSDCVMPYEPKNRGSHACRSTDHTKPALLTHKRHPRLRFLVHQILQRKTRLLNRSSTVRMLPGCCAFTRKRSKRWRGMV